VWASSAARDPGQIKQSRSFWGVPRFDLLQVHNLLAWEEHLAMLFEIMAVERSRYVGVTTSEGRRHDLFERIMPMHPFLAVLDGRPAQAEVFGIAPDPLAIATLGLMTMGTGSDALWLLFVQTTWCVTSGVTLFA
jgi:hypothetical protein